jgi:hypothetical protein
MLRLRSADCNRNGVNSERPGIEIRGGKHRAMVWTGTTSPERVVVDDQG